MPYGDRAYHIETEKNEQKKQNLQKIFCRLNKNCIFAIILMGIKLIPIELFEHEILR